MHTPCGPTLLTGGQWTRVVLGVVGRIGVCTCLRCHLATQTFMPVVILTLLLLMILHFLLASLHAWRVVALLLVVAFA